MNKKNILIDEIKKLESKSMNIMVSTNSCGTNLQIGNHIENLDKKYEIGSSSKMFASISIFLLEERGLLNTDHEIGKYLEPSIKKLLLVNERDYSKVNIKSVLNHTSGLGEHLNSGDDEKVLEVALSKVGDFSIEEIFQMALENKVQKFEEPYKQIQYSNIGYILIGKIIEFVAGISYKEFIRENIFKVLDMNDSLFISDNSSDPNILTGGFGGKPSRMVPSLARAAGEIISTLEDMRKFLEGVFSYKLISQDTLEVILKSAKDKTLSSDRVFGYGFYEENGFIGHAGQTFGFLTKAFYKIPDKKYMIISINDALAGTEIVKLTEIITS